MSNSLIVLLLTLLLGIQPVATDLYLPALPSIVVELGTTVQQAQLTLSALLLSFGFSQLLWGPLSDRFGRKPILIAGLTTYAFASVASIFVGSIEQLIFWRIVQGSALGATVMCARAIVRDLYDPVDGIKRMSQGLTGLGIIACMSAPVGGLLTYQFGWQATMAASAVFGCLTLLFVVSQLKESAPAQASHTLSSWLYVQRDIVRNQTFWTYSVLSAASYAGLLSFLSSSSFVFIDQFAFSKIGYGLLMFGMSLTYIIGTFTSRWLILRLGVTGTVKLGSLISLGGGIAMGVVVASSTYTPWTVYLPFLLFIFSHGINQPCSQMGSVGPFPHAAGSASALSGFFMMWVGFWTVEWIGSMSNVGTSDSITVAMLRSISMWSVMISITAWVFVPRFGTPKHPPKRVLHIDEP